MDDDLSLREALASALRRAGHAVDEAVNGAQALERARAHAPAAIFLDLEMPELDGRGFLEARRAVPDLANTPVVLMSGRQAEAAELVGRFPVVYPLFKPFGVSEVRAALDWVALVASAAGKVR